MSNRTLELANVVHWDRQAHDKVYLESVRVAVELFPFDNRQVFIRFDRGPDLDLSIWDMDRLVAAYQALREAAALGKVDKPDPCDFTVNVQHSRQVGPMFKRAPEPNSGEEASSQSGLSRGSHSCRRCAQRYEGCGDGYNGFCPECADHFFSRLCDVCARPVALEHGCLHHVTENGEVDDVQDRGHAATVG